MSGFSTEWLHLREPADHRARDAALSARLATHLQGREGVTILDLGCGTGSNLRALSGLLPPRRQKWRLIDHDDALLAAARTAISNWARRIEGGPKLCLEYRPADLRTALPELLTGKCDLVTAAALFDLVSRDWLDALVVQLTAHRLPLYTVLIFDGAMSWEPPHPADARVTAAFAAHQHTDKGFGPAAGPDAAAHITAAFEAAGYEVLTVPSPWVLGPNDAALIAATTAGIAHAAQETGTIPPADIDAWLAHHGNCQNCRIGHIDLLALPHPQASPSKG